MICVYDLSNQMVQVLNNSNQVAAYTYNGAGQRIKKNAQGSVRVFHYNHLGYLISETTETGQTLVEYIYIGSNLLAKIQGEQVYYYHNDHLGTPQILTDDSGSIVWKAAYTPFGEAQVSIGVVENPHRFRGQYYDAETGLHYNYFRYYNPQTGRYITPDPIGLEGGINLFTYVAGNPVNFVDPEGLLYGIDMGEAYGERASLYWATLAINPDNAWYQTVAYTTMGLFASLWTPTTSEETFETLLFAYLIGRGLELPIIDPLNDYPANPNEWKPPKGWKETPACEKTGGRHRQWREPNDELKRWDREGRHGGKERGPHWHDSRFPERKHIKPNK
jgi:RHS repeat-associated protein